METQIGLYVFIILSLCLVISMFVLVANMARNRNRNVTIWVLLSLFTSPLLMCFILLIIGSKDIDDGFD